MSLLSQLYQLQQIDSEIRQGKIRLAEVLKAQRPGADLLASRERAAAAEEALASQRRQQRELDLALKSLIGEKDSTESRLYSGTVRNPKELTDLQEKVESLKRRRAVLEDRLLEVMIALEEAEEEAEAASGELAALEAAHAGATTTLQEEQKSLAVRINELLGERARKVPAIPADTLAKYSAIAQRQHDGVAVAMIRGNSCMGCRVVIPANRIKSAREGELAYCDSCGRLISPA